MELVLDIAILFKKQGFGGLNLIVVTAPGNYSTSLGTVVLVRVQQFSMFRL